MCFKCRNITEVLMGNQEVLVGQSSQQETPIDNAYLGRERRFVDDKQTSLNGHVKHFREQLEDMLAGFKTFEAQWAEKLNDRITKAGEMEENRAKLSGQLFDFKRII